MGLKVKGFVLGLAVSFIGSTVVSADTTWGDFKINDTGNEEVSVQSIQQVINEKGKSTKLKESHVATYIVEASNTYHINAGVLFSMMMYETGWGSSNLFIRHNNVGGLECMDGYKCAGRWSVFPSLKESIFRKAELLSSNYVDKGFVQLKDVVSKYAPSHENDVNGYIQSIGSIMNEYLHLDGRNVESIKDKQHRMMLAEEEKQKALKKKDKQSTKIVVKDNKKKIDLFGLRPVQFRYTFDKRLVAYLN